MAVGARGLSIGSGAPWQAAARGELVVVVRVEGGLAGGGGGEGGFSEGSSTMERAIATTFLLLPYKVLGLQMEIEMSLYSSCLRRSMRFPKVQKVVKSFTC